MTADAASPSFPTSDPIDHIDHMRSGAGSDGRGAAPMHQRAVDALVAEASADLAGSAPATVETVSIRIPIGLHAEIADDPNLVLRFLAAYRRLKQNRAEGIEQPAMLATLEDDGRLSVRIAPRFSLMSDRAPAAAVEATDAAVRRAEDFFATNPLLTAAEFALRLGVKRQTVDNWRKDGRVIAYQRSKRGFGYPEAQIGADGNLLAGLEEALGRIGDNGYRAHRIMTTPRDDLAGRTPFEGLRAGRVSETMDAL